MRLGAAVWCGVGLVGVACLVPDVELVDHLPGDANRAGASSSGTSGVLGGEGSGASGNRGGSANAGDGGTSATAEGGAPDATKGGAGAGGASGPPDTTSKSCSKLSNDACNGESCCASVLLEGCKHCEFPEGVASTTVSEFRLDKYEVTVGRFRAFVDEYQGPPDVDAGAKPGNGASGWQEEWNGLIAANATQLRANLVQYECKNKNVHTWTKDPAEQEQKPMNCVTWYEAFAFCVWDGGFLPSELEWQFAATGGLEYRQYPWEGPDLDIDHALYGACGNGVSAVCDETAILDVGSKPAGAGRWGHLDLTGSMWEWMLDTTATAFPIEQPCLDCMNADWSGYSRNIRGGSWPEDSSFMLPANRSYADPPGDAWYNVGIRCARLP